MRQSVRYLGLILVMLLGLYPIAELTRVIVVSGTYYFPDMDGQFIAEITIMWFLYLLIIPVFLLINKQANDSRRKIKNGAEKGKNDGRQREEITDGRDIIIRVDYQK